MIDSNKCDFELLYDEAVEQDLFEDKTHEHLANSLAKLIGGKNKGLTIGLEGGWGSGKSVVVSLLKKTLARNVNILFFTFDAWAHEGDPLRRVFLESLIETIKTNNLSGGIDKLDEIERTISNKMRIVKITTSRTVSWLAKTLAISALLIPIGTSLFPETPHPQKDYVIPVILILSPLLVLAFRFIWLLIMGVINLFTRDSLRLSEKKSMWWRKVCNNKTWAMLTDETTETSDQEVTDDTERSSIEFEDYFNQILDIYFSKSDRRLVIVADNLDRVNSEDALKIWSTLQTFLQQRSVPESRKKWFDKIWLLVPFDPDGLSKIWKSTADCGGEDKARNSDCAKSFFDKCFQLRLEVPRLILTGWESFARELIKKSLINLNDDEKNAVFEVMKTSQENMGDIPSPREIKNYINQVGLMRAYSDKEIPTRSVAYYVLHRYIRSEYRSSFLMQNALLNGNMPKKEHKEFLPKDCVSHCAGLLFGVEPVKGRQLLLGAEIEEALKFADGPKIKLLEKTYGDGFWVVFDAVIEKTKLNFGLILVYSDAVLNSIFLFMPDKCNKLITRVANFITSEDTLFWPEKNQIELVKSLITILKSKQVVLEKLHEKLVKQFVVLLESKEDFDCVNNVVSLSSLKSYFSRDISEQSVNVNIDFPKLKKWVSAVFLKKIPAWLWIKPNQNITETVSQLVQSNNPRFEDLGDSIDYSIRSGLVSGWGSVVKMCANNIKYNHGNYIDTFHNLDSFKILTMITLNDDEIFQEVCDLVKSHEFCNLLWVATNKKNAYAPILCGYCLKSELQNFQPSNYVNAKSGVQAIKKFWLEPNTENARDVIAILAQYNKWDVVWRMIDDSRNKLVGEIIGLVVQEEAAKSFFNTSDALSKFKKCLNMCNNDEKKREVALRFIQYSNIEQEIEGDENLNVVEFGCELSFMLEITNNQKIFEKIREKLEQLDKKIWLIALKENTYTTSLALSVRNSMSDFALKGGFRDGVYDYILEVNQGVSNPSDWQKENWGKLVGLLEDDFIEQFKNRITQFYVSENFIVKEQVHALIEPYLDANIIVEEAAKMEYVIEKLLDEQNYLKLNQFFLMLKKKNITKIETRKPFQSVIKDKLVKLYGVTNDDNHKATLENIATFFKINIYKQSGDEV